MDALMWGQRLCVATAALLVWGASAIAESNSVIRLQSPFPPLLVADAPNGGAHPIGGPVMHFVDITNELLRPMDLQIAFHVSGDIHPADIGRVGTPMVAIPGDFPSIHAAVAAGAAGGGVDAGVGLPNMSGQPFGELLVAALPFGMEPDEYAAYLYEGGGLALQQELYDTAFDGQIVVLPIAITPTQGGGWFPAPLPDPDQDDALSAEAAMARLCHTPMIVRWPEPGSQVWRRACTDVGVETALIGAGTRCADVAAGCPSADNPVTHESSSLTFGGFVFGGLPHRLALLGHIDAYELNTPYTDVIMMKLAQGAEMTPNAEADLRPVIEKAPYYYGSTWHQPLSYVELLVNRSVWDGLSPDQRRAIDTAARAATLANWAVSLDYQDRGMALLEANGAVTLRWPEGLLALLRAASDRYLDERADALAAKGDASYRRVLDHQRAYMRRHQLYWDLGDVNQGRAGLPTSPDP